MGDDAATVEQLRAELREAREEIERRDRVLAEAQEQQRATADVLRAIASSPSSLQTVLDAVVTSAIDLCEASGAAIRRIEGNELLVVATAGTDVRPRNDLPLQPLDRSSVTGTAILERRAVHSYESDAEHQARYPNSTARRHGIQTQVQVPLLRDGSPIGALGVYRREPRPFSERQIALLETFADQAVIAIENARLFEELEQRNAGATGEQSPGHRGAGAADRHG